MELSFTFNIWLTFIHIAAYHYSSFILTKIFQSINIIVYSYTLLLMDIWVIFRFLLFEEHVMCRCLHIYKSCSWANT